MGWLGKILGGAVGFAVGGPLGAVGGAAMGHLLDASQSENRTRCPHCGEWLKVPGKGQWRCPDCGGQFHFGRPSEIPASAPESSEQAQYVFFVALFSMLGKLAKADGQVSAAEIRLVEEFMTRQLRLDGQARQAAQRIFNEAKDSPYSFEDFARQYRQFIGHERQMLLQMMGLLVRVAAADGEVHPEEERLLRAAALIFGVSDGEYARLRQQHVDSLESHYSLLGCTPADSDREVRRAYHKKVAEYHPDKLVSKGLPEDFLEFATQKAKEINRAYDTIMSARK
jgi:DnaJ like chaperone protein